jgi:hypothetical protein
VAAVAVVAPPVVAGRMLEPRKRGEVVAVAEAGVEEQILGFGEAERQPEKDAFHSIFKILKLEVKRNNIVT